MHDCDYLGLLAASPRKDLSKSSCGRARMWELTSSPTFAAALDPASTAALTLPTSPLHNTVISPPPIGMVLTRPTLAALTIASLASTLPTYPFVSIIPNASLIVLFFLLID